MFRKQNNEPATKNDNEQAYESFVNFNGIICHNQMSNGSSCINYASSAKARC